MPEQKETAEQKLLKMIEGSAGSPASEQKASKKKEDVLSVIKLANRLLVFGLIVAVLFVFLQIKSGIELNSKKIDVDSTRVNVTQANIKKAIVPLLQRLSFYLSGTTRRNIFLPYEAKLKKSGMSAKGSGSSNIAKITRNFKLVGVSWLDTVESASVMIEDINKSETYFLQQGEKIGDITVKTIYADGVEFGYKDEEIIIRYDE